MKLTQRQIYHLPLRLFSNDDTNSDNVLSYYPGVKGEKPYNLLPIACKCTFDLKHCVYTRTPGFE